MIIEMEADGWRVYHFDNGEVLYGRDTSRVMCNVKEIHGHKGKWEVGVCIREPDPHFVEVCFSSLEDAKEECNLIMLEEELKR